MNVHILLRCTSCNHLKYGSDNIVSSCDKCSSKLMRSNADDPWDVFLKSKLNFNVEIESLENLATYYNIAKLFKSSRCKLLRLFASSNYNTPLSLQWNLLGVFGRNKIFASSYILLFFIPLLVKLASHIPYFDISIPTIYLISYIGAWSIAIAHTLYYFFSPSPFKIYRYKDEFLEHIVLNKLPTYSNANLVISFWEIANRKYPFIRIVIAMLYLLGFISISIIMVNNVYVVMKHGF